MLVLNANAMPTYLENNSPRMGAWIDVRLVGTVANRDAIGASVKILAAEREQVAMIHAGRGYQSHYGTILHFGLGGASKVEKISVTWPGGMRETFNCNEIRTTLLLVQGQGFQ